MALSLIRVCMLEMGGGGGVCWSEGVWRRRRAVEEVLALSLRLMGVGEGEGVSGKTPCPLHQFLLAS